MAMLRPILSAVLAFALCAGCGAPSAPDPVATDAEVAPPRPPVDFDLAALDIERPCSLLSMRDAEHLTGRRFYDIVANNRVDADRVRCAFAVGEGGISGMVQLDIYYPSPTFVPEVFWRAQCRPGASAPPTRAAKACVTIDNAYAARLGDHVIVASVGREPGKIDQAVSLRFLNLITYRLQGVLNEG